ncbi:hypothetical protein EVG20_g8903 [Dentipellis fragilis]|uniref:Uncharacterized protein n=1 Tax=Dentipellis fragilis TaxID=205917 RepID=A0A4Y9Y2L6_9AGAM|nr:hypothetical protein EVG20_g8903 [Dentipellis fragilis]
MCCPEPIPRQRRAVGTQAGMLYARRQRCSAEDIHVSDLDVSRANSADHLSSRPAHTAGLAGLLILTMISSRDTAAAAFHDIRQDGQLEQTATAPT